VRKTVAVLAAAMLGATAPAIAQAADPDTTALRNAVTRAEVLRYEQRLQAIAMSNENNRATATTGNWESLDYVIKELRKMGYNPSYVPYVTGGTWSERTPPVLERTLPDGTTKTYINALTGTGEYSQMTNGHTTDLTAKVIPVANMVIPPVGTQDSNDSGCRLGDFPAAVKDHIALVQRGRCSFLEKIANARAAGAKAVFVMNEGNTGQPNRNTPGTPGRLASQTYPGLPAASLSYLTGKEFYDAAQAGEPLTVHFKTDNNLTQRIDYDIIAETATGDPTRVLQVGAHIDGVGSTTNQNGNHGPGINDDGSGTAMTLAIANQIKKLNLPLKYKIRFGWFSGEEQGLNGSQQYANQLDTLTAQRTLGMLDYDMLGSTNFIPFVYVPNPNPSTPCTLYTCPPGSDEAILAAPHNDYLQTRLNLTSTAYPVDNRSDYAGFRGRRIPATGLYTGAETLKTPAMVTQYGGQGGIQADPCYHEWCDTVFNLSEYGLNEFTDVLAHATLSFAGLGNDAVETSVRPEVPTPVPTP
jgi:Zn-dependent M28 family amino/carboxypeptidase